MKKGNLLEAPTSLVSCVSKDLKMTQGLAKHFKNKWPGQVDELKKMELEVGDIGAIKVDERFIYHLIIKGKFNEPPKQDHLKQTLAKLKEHMVENEITEVSLPKIGSGLNRISWPDVKTMIEEVFQDTNIKIVIYTL